MNVKFTAISITKHAAADGLGAETGKIELDGGDLMITWRETDKHVILRGSATLSFQGTLNSDIEVCPIYLWTRRP